MTVPWQDVEIIIGDDGKSAIQRVQVHRGSEFQALAPRKTKPEDHAKAVAGGFRNDRTMTTATITVEFLDPNLGWVAAGR